MNQFGGFTAQQMEAIARQMGYDGPMSGFNDFLAASPGNAAKLNQYTLKAKKLVEQRASSQNNTQGFASGGVVTNSTEKETDNTSTSSQKTVYPHMDRVTNRAINSPESLVTQVKPLHNIQQEKSQLVNVNSGDAGDVEKAKTAQTTQTATATAATQPKTETATATLTENKVKAETDQLEAAKGTVGANSQVQAQTALPSADATVAGQLAKLYAGFDEGNIPPWAAGAKRMADQMMISRGLGSSSMAAEASTQTLMESALQIAVQDASTYSAFEMKNLDNRQQAALFNAQAFLQMDLANLENEQQTRLFKTQTRVQSMFSDQAAENAMKQFNATNKNQANQFFAQLKTQTSQFNAAQRNAVNMSNTEQANTVGMFNAQLKAQREQFNTENRLIIDQSNAEWRRQIATEENAQQNENNRLNAQLMTGMTTAAYNNLWQRERDLMSYAFTSSENAANRALQITLQKMSDATQKKVAGQDSDASMWLAGGKLAAEVVFGSDWGGIF